MKITSEELTLKSGRSVKKFMLENDYGMKVEVLSLGATLTKVIVPDAQGNLENVVLGWQDINLYEMHPGYMGAIVGRAAGRIYKGQVTLSDKTYHFPINTFENTLHGGMKGFHIKDWEGTLSKTEDEAMLKLDYLSVDGEEGFPGNLKVSVTYTLDNKNDLAISYTATTDKETIVNLTNHAYFNLSGNAKTDILDEEVYIDSDYIYELDHELIPTGKIMSIKDTPYFDFTTPKKIGQDIEKENKALQDGCGYDHIWKLNQGKDAIRLVDHNSGRCMSISTTEPDVVMYTMNHADDPFILENGSRQQPRYAVCFETQKVAIGYNEVNKDGVILKPNEIYNQKTVFSFSNK